MMQNDAAFGKYRFKPFQNSFFKGFYIKIMFWVRWFYSLFDRLRLKRKKTMFIYTNQPSITSFHIKKYLFFAELAMSQPWSAIFRATGAWGGKPIGRLRVNQSAGFEWANMIPITQTQNDHFFGNFVFFGKNFWFYFL